MPYAPLLTEPEIAVSLGSVRMLLFSQAAAGALRVRAWPTGGSCSFASEASGFGPSLR